jgi:ATP-binding cassette subfamily C protein
MGNPNLPILNGEAHWPISTYTWLQAVEESTLTGIPTETFIGQDLTWSALAKFHNLVLHHVQLDMQQTALSEKERLQNKTITNQLIVEEAFTRLAAPLGAPEDQALLASETQEPLLQAYQLVADRLNLKIQSPPGFGKGKTFQSPLREVAKASRFRIRLVALKGTWWKQDNGPLLAFLEKDRQPVALLPGARKKYELHDPVAHTKTVVTEKVAATLDPFAYMFYRPFPARVMSAWELLKFGIQGQKNDLSMIVVTGIAVGLLALLVPVATGVIFDSIIPSAERPQLLQLSLALLVITVAAAMFQISQNVAILRLRGRLSGTIQAAIWDRLLSLPVSFFRHYTAGDLGTRVMGINTIEQILTGTAIGAILSGVFSTFSFILLFYYNSRLALIATGLVLLSMAVTAFVSYSQVRYQRKAVEQEGKISGVVLQAITGITKFRAAGAEGRAFAFWSKEFSLLKQITYKARDVANNLTVFNAGYQVVTAMAIFAMVAFSIRANMSTGTFLAFNAAFVQFITAVLTLSTAFVATLSIVPLYERVQPILQALPEVDELKADPGELTGGVEVSHVSFRYYADAPDILKDVSLHVNPGEFVALVGASGSGKTTLFRLLLGFETPLSGAIYYDGKNLAGLDIREVRRQIGVVLQNGQLMTGDIFTNIIGSSLLTLDDAWEAARMAGLDEDIKQMPMGMHTVISAGGGTLSGGQRQRLLIARAIVHKPRILFFDEATSALDNRTQAIVSESLENLQATRIVIAHRLSTIMNADRIYVLQRGQVVQSGTYSELISQEGLFADLAKRQIV